MADEDGVVAIVEGLRDAGLAVTVLNRRLLRNRNSYRRAQASKSSVETNTDRWYGNSFLINRGTGVSDGHYASSYQIAHCSARPTSPPQNSPEFPPQRCRPSRTKGNFELNSNYDIWNPITSSLRAHRGRYFERSERGSMYGNHGERLSHDTFAHSLRRYPACSPERTMSFELVQKLLSYTQNKYLSKSTLKTQRFQNRDKSPLISKPEVKPSKNIQTYTRTKPEVNTRDFSANTSNDLEFINNQGRSFSTHKVKYGNMSEKIESTYDYLELEYPSISRHSRRTHEVRYLRDFKKYIRNTIRQIYDDSPLVCPNIRSRYSNHRRLHHTGENTQTSSQSIKVQASTSKATVFTHCEPPPGTHPYPTQANACTFDTICCNCNKPKPCVCEQKAQKAAEIVNQHITDWLNELPVYTEKSRENERKKQQMIKELDDIISKVPKDENYQENIRKEIESFVEDLPMWNPGVEDETEYKQEVIDSLKYRLQNPEDRTADTVKDTVRKWLNNIQFDRNIDMDKTVNNFAGHLTPIINDAGELKIKLKELLEDLPITNKRKVINDLQDDFANDLAVLSASDTLVLTDYELENEINEFLEDHPDILDLGDKVKNLVKKLKNTQNKSVNEDVKIEEMKENVIDWIDTLPKTIREEFTLKKKEVFSNDLVDKVQSAANSKAIDRISSLQTQNEIENEIWDILESIDVDLSDVDKSTVKKYALNLREIEKSDIDEEAVANETIHFLNELDKSGITIRSRDQIQNIVLSKLKRIQVKDRERSGGRRSSFVTSTPRKGRPPSRRDFNVSSIGKDDESSYYIAGSSDRKNAEKQYNNKLIDKIESWVDTLPINLDSDKKVKKIMINDLANDIMDRQKYLQIHPDAVKSYTEELEHMKYQIFRWLNKMDNIKDHEMAVVMDKSNNLMDKIKNVDVPQFNKSSLRSVSRAHSFGSPTRGQSFSYKTDIPTQNSSIFIIENLDGAITDWIKLLPLYEKANPEQKRFFLEVIPEISKGIKRVYDSSDHLEQDTDKLVIDVIVKQMYDFPISTKDKNDDKFMARTAEQLLQYLKDLKMFQNLSERKNVPYDEYLKQTIDDWANSFSLTHLSSNEKVQFGGLKEELTIKLKQARKDGVDGDKLKSEIKKIINKFPLKDSGNNENQDRKVEELLKALTTVPAAANSRIIPDIKDSRDAGQIVKDLKDLQMLQDTPKTTITISREDLESIVDSFINDNLELQKGTWFDKEKFVKLKSELVTKLKELIDNETDHDEIKKEVQYYLSRFPLSEEERRDNRFLEKKAENLLKGIPSQSSPDAYSYVRKGIMKWMKSLQLDEGKNINDIPKQAVDEITRRLSDHIIHTDVVSIADTKKKIEEETNRFLQNTPLDKNKSHDHKKLAKDLFDFIKLYSKAKDKTSSTSTKEYLPPSNKVSAMPTSTEALMRSNISGSLHRQDNNKTSSKDKNTKGSTPTKSKLTSIETLLSNKSGSMHPSLKSAADQLADNIEQWVNNLPIKEDTLKDNHKASDLRRHLASKIITKVGELNTNPEIFNDDFLYEEIFEEEVDNLITALSSDDLRSKMPLHKKNLIEIVKHARLKTQEEMAGTVYKQQLREVVSKTIPSESLTENENASFEVLKEDVADAFVALHYVEGDAKSKKIFKNNVKGEIDEFCDDYLKTHPKPAINTEKLNSDLYKALKDVPVPKDETMRHEIEKVKIKEVINQWINEGKLFGDQTGRYRLKTKKRICVLAKKVHDIEKLKESNSDFDSHDMLKNDIIQWLEKMPLVVEDELDILAEKLIKKLKETEESRKLLRSDSSGKESIMPTSSYSNGPWSSQTDSNVLPRGSSRPRFSNSSRLSGSKRRSIVSPTSRTGGLVTHGSKRGTADISTIPEVSRRTTAEASTAPEFTIVPSPCAPPCGLPLSTLTPEDREYLRKIRERVIQSMTQSNPRYSKDVGVSPIPVDYSSQTEITTDKMTTTQVHSSSRLPQTSGSQIPKTQTAGSQIEIVPDVIVKEYNWDTINSKMSSTCPPMPCQPCRQITEATSPLRPCYQSPPRTSQQAQTSPPCPEDFDPVYQEHPYLPDHPEPCPSKCRRSKQCYHNEEPNIPESNRNLSWSKEDFYGERREPFDEENNIADPSRRIKRCACRNRITLPCHDNMKKRACRSCRGPSPEPMRTCPKCCGFHCPFPSYLYFNKR